MTVNAFFHHYNCQEEQDLMEDLMIESIQNRGLDVNYIIRDRIDNDYLFGEAPLSEFNDAVVVEMYIKEMDQFNGIADSFTPFGFEMNDRCTLVVSRKRFKEEMLANDLEEISEFGPREGDLIHLPFSNQLFQINKFTSGETFNQGGENYIYEFPCTLFANSHESFDTGNEAIDDFENINHELFAEPFNEEDMIVDDIKEDIVFEEDDPYTTLSTISDDSCLKIIG